jgi:heme-degrading monooxygenase HmoA
MIVRVLTAHVVAGHEGEFNMRVRERLDIIRKAPGNRYVKFARQIEDTGRERIILITEWATPADLYTWAQGDVDRVHFVDVDLVEDWQIEHWEALDMRPLDEAKDQGPSPPTRVG